MVASTQKKPLFEGNISSNSQPLFFEFNLEPTPVSFKPQAKLSTPPISSNGKKVLNIASRLVLGLIITVLVLGSGVLNNELFTGKSGTQANLSWIPSWSADSPANADPTTASVGISEIAKAPINPAPVFIPSETSNTFSPVVAGLANKAAPADLLATPTTETAAEATNPAEPAEGLKSTIRPMIKPPVSQSEVKLSNPVINRTVVGTATSKITSEAYHAISTQSSLDGKKVFIKFGAKWCLPCRMMEANVFPDPEISQLLAKNYHTLTVDVDNIDGINLRQFYQVEALPSFIVLDNQQNILGKYEGAQRIEDLRSILGRTAP